MNLRSIPGFRSGKKWKMALASIGYFFVFLIIVGAIFGSSETTTGNSQPSTQTAEETVYALGEPVVVDTATFTAHRALAVGALGSGQLSKQPDGVYVVIEMEIENTGQRSIYLSTGDFNLHDEQGRTYNMNSEASVYLNIMGLDSFIFKELGPGLTTRGYIAFDVPPEDKGLVLQVRNSIFSGGKIIRIGDVAEL